jgi:hypothetical protein
MFSSMTTTTCHTTTSKPRSTIGSSDCNTLNNAREYIHEAFQTAEQRQAEKPVMVKIEEAMPSSAEEAVESVSDALNSGLESVEEKLHDRLHENRPSSSAEVAASSMSDTSNSGFLPEFLESVEDLSQVWPIDGSMDNKENDKGFVSDSVDATKDVIGSVRENVYDATKSAEEKETEQQAEKPCTEKLTDAIHLRS